MPSGSIQRVAEGVHVEAPADGYRLQWQGNFDTSYRMVHAFYFRTTSREQFGALDIEWTAYFNKTGQAAVTAHYQVNTAGGRELLARDEPQ